MLKTVVLKYCQPDYPLTDCCCKIIGAKERVDNKQREKMSPMTGEKVSDSFREREREREKLLLILTKSSIKLNEGERLD
jgi:hypothetical protein